MKNTPLNEYPRPQLYRESYLSLNGYWDYCISKNDEIPTNYEGKILVPFSPETELSEVNKIVKPDEYLFYRLNFSISDFVIKDKVILHFLAVDQIADVYLNGHYLGNHVGGFLPFEFEIQKYITTDKNELVVRVKDYSDTSYHSRGKQKIERGGIWYTPQSGIYFPVWIESVSSDYIQNVKFTPDIDKSEIVINIKTVAKEATIHIFGMDRPIDTNKDVHVKVKDMHLWSPEDPYLYFVRINTDNDEVTSYFAMRKFSIIKDESNISRIALNNKPYFMKGILDQGYYKKGLLTPSSYDDYVKDIELVKSLGFNTIRKHIKIEMPRWYFECDKRGIVVWQDFVNGGEKYKFSTIAFPLITGRHHKDTNYKKFARENIEGRKEALQEFKNTINYLYNVPSIALWTIFNEGWGQFDSKYIYEEMKKIDNTRLYDHASGWHDQGISDVKSYHVYFKNFKCKKDKNDRAVILSEFGGFVYKIENHSQGGKKTYKEFDNPDNWLKRYKKSIEIDILNNIPKGLSAMIYTQLSDVEDECNGFVTFDREIVKIDPKEIKLINSKI
ncbi:MAG: glycoside hydrolase family 2 [Bacilli bacterium]|nr:glycoside hydrolase family 2 [Bacilli bacterium]